jgi:hypothetical protein
VSKTPLEPPHYVTTKEAYRLLGVSRARFHEWTKAGLISPAWFNGNRPMYLRTDVLALPDRLGGSKPVAPLLPPEDQALARERVGEPDFAGLFAEDFQRLVPSLGEKDARRRALANTIRAYRIHHGCAYKPASAVVRALIPPKAPPTDSVGPLLSGEALPVGQQQPAIEPAGWRGKI